MRGLFITGTDTEVGKTVVTAAVCASLAARGERVAAFKPVVTGLDDEPGDWPRDHELLARVASAGQSPEGVAPLRFGPPVSPHLAAEQAGPTMEPHALVRAARATAERADVLVCEGVGGLMVPLTTGYSIRDLALDLHLPLVVAARPGLGTINHTLLTIEAARAAGLQIRAVVLTPWPEDPSPMEASNRRTIATLGDVEVATLRRVGRLDVTDLADAGQELPYDRWLS